MSTGLYSYAICRGVSVDDLAGKVGIGGAPLRLVEQDGLAAVVSEVDLDEFGEEGLKRNLEDLAWLETVAVAHDRVTRLVAGRAPTAPLRLATVFLGEGSLREQLTQWHQRAERALDRVEGRSEWSVKVYVDPGARSGGSQDEPAPEGMGAGKAYLLKRRAATQRRESLAEADAAMADEIHVTLQGASVAGRRLPPQDRRLTGHTGEMVLNGTYLVDEGRVTVFKDLVDALAEQHAGVRVEVGGPWPPYSFASLDEQ